MTSTAATTTVPALYVSNNGRVACPTHGGAYLTDTATRRPNARTLTTPLDHWMRVTGADVALMDADERDFMACEDCGATPEPVKVPETKAARDLSQGDRIVTPAGATVVVVSTARVGREVYVYVAGQTAPFACRPTGRIALASHA